VKVDGVESARVAKSLIEAFAARDVKRIVSHLTEDAVLEPSAFITGRGRYDGHDDVLEGFAEMEHDLAARGEDVTMRVSRYYVDREQPDLVLGLGFITITRAYGDEFGTEVAYLWTLSGDKVTRLKTWLDHAEGYAQLDDPVEVEP
jgi:ketosteroid isomerase-like protein